MDDYTVYRLKFKTQLHLGRATGAAQTGSLGLEKTETYISADTLFSAICQTWSTFYDSESLTEFLKRYVEDSETLPFMLTSAFPYADNVYFFPKPLTFRGDEDTSDDSKKNIKKVRFISESVFRRIISNESSDFDKGSLISGQNVWVSADEKEQLKNVLITAEERKHLKQVKDENLYIMTTSNRPRVTIGAQNAGSEIWHVQTVQFNTNCGLWFAAKFDSDATKQKVETLLRVLGDNGIGGERNAGYGQFKFTPAELDIPTAEDCNQFVTLSPIRPKTPEQLERLLIGNIAYNLNAKTGWVGAPGTHKRRKTVHMFSEGSVFNTSDVSIGSLVDLTPENYPHPVYRYGYAWQIGITM
ncbi:type III-A CRISPR-associated RAMP protein Csm4 [Candidatus Poribacteria bacterium]|nr:type III-A CRISPR-associated RAMP protein Csm4 [Candidatus Poribacteria bacterium]MYB66623.1 type III-A CRISPR-associated RAMP protein Csm4 [Candidatus Poribacteria bacterium]MYF56794.1 type III-A CRISPR-associated RAMP protein Csm4 [Candidatus Poribacteria bacterium]